MGAGYLLVKNKSSKIKYNSSEPHISMFIEIFFSGYKTTTMGWIWSDNTFFAWNPETV